MFFLSEVSKTQQYGTQIKKKKSKKKKKSTYFL